MNKKKKSISSNDIDLGRIPPQAVDLEKALIGALLLEKGALSIVAPILKPEMFYFQAHSLIYKAILSLDKEQKPIDMLTIMEKLRSTGELEAVGGVSFITGLTSQVTSSAHAEYHAQIVAQKYLARELISVTARIQANAYDETQDIDDILTDAEKGITSLREGTVDSSGLVPIFKLIGESLSQMHERREVFAKGLQMGVNTGLSDLNKITNGWQKGELTIIAARPAMGKTAMALHIAKSAAKNGTPVAIFSLEMTGVSLSNRLILSEAGISPDNFKSGKLSNEELSEAELAGGRLSCLPIYVDDNSITTISKIRAKARILKQKDKCGMIVIDYLQLADGDDKSGNREQEIASISRGAKKIAKDLDIPVILLSQLSRAVEQRENKIPQLSDLRESGAIEQDADMVMFIYRPEYYKKQVNDAYGNPIENYIELIIAKYRNGATGNVKAVHNGSLTKIYDYDDKGYSNFSPATKLHSKKVEEEDYMPF